jgi:endonuclease/exonuclease/phosphatase family metal-dependent hydrolase
MADTNERPSLRVISVSSHDTALCVIPPECGYIDGLRELYDKAYGLWPPHINLVYPFVKPTSLRQAHQRIKSYFDEHLNPSDPRTVSMDEAGVFRNRKTDTIFLREGQDSSSSHLSNLRSMALEALGQTPTASTLHLTVGQPEDKTLDSRDFLLAKAQLLPALNFRIGALAILLCERLPGSDAHHMRLWGTIDVTHSEDAWQPHSQEYWIRQPIQALHPHSSKSGEDSTNADTPGYTRNVKLGITHQYSSDQDIWIACTGSDDMNSQNTCAISIASYNVLVESDFPPARDRDVLLARTILSDSAMADILVLQEVSDDFLSSLLGDPEVQRRYPFASHAPPSQENIGPLFSLRNIVILSRWRFNWESLPLNRRHKSAMVAKFEGIFQSNSSRFIVAGVHLTSGLTDGSVAAKKAQLEALTTYLTESYGSEPWAIAGDFNIPTSEYTIETAQKNNSITIPTKVALKSMEASLVMSGLLDTWAVARVEATDGTGMSMDDDLLEGEDGCTFDPRNNMLAAGSVITSENRPQRYDRVLVNPRDKLQITGFKIFGHTEDVDGIQVVASDHSGVRASMSVLDGQQKSADHSSIAAPSPVEYRRAVELLSESSDLKLVLEAHRMFPTSSEVEQRRHAFTLLKQAVLGLAVDNNLASADTPLVVVAVGSYALGVWTSDSDIDCLCIGTISSKTFFKLVRQRLLKAENQGVRILRKVEANSGTMLELSINGVATDLQYCPAAQVVER